MDFNPAFASTSDLMDPQLKALKKSASITSKLFLLKSRIVRQGPEGPTFEEEE
jgi:hypothetical protein